jgi:hypothetical protein
MWLGRFVAVQALGDWVVAVTAVAPWPAEALQELGDGDAKDRLVRSFGGFPDAVLQAVVSAAG